jgi:hypothetical protein
MKIISIVVAVLGVLRFGAAIVVGVRDGIIARRIRRGSNGQVLVGKAAVRYGVFSAIAGLILLLLMLSIIGFAIVDA